MMMYFRLLIAAGFLVSASISWAMGNSLTSAGRWSQASMHYLIPDCPGALKKIIATHDIKQLIELVHEINTISMNSYQLAKEEKLADDLIELAIKTGNRELVGLVLDIDVIRKVVLKTGKGLFFAMHDADMVKLLLDRGMFGYARDRCGGTPILRALLATFSTIELFKFEELMINELYETQKLLLKCDVLDPNLELNEKKDRPLHIVCRENKSMYFKPTWNFFIQNGADPELKNADGDTPRDVFLKKHGQEEWQKLMGIEKKAEAKPVQIVEIVPLDNENKSAAIDNQTLDCAQKVMRKKIRKKILVKIRRNT